MGDRHKTPRVFASGSQKRKLHAEREKKSEETIAKTPKLTNYFTTSSKQQDVPRNTNNTAENSMRDEDLVNSTQNNSIDAAGETTEPSKIVEENQSQAECSGFKNDIGLWPNVITEEMVKYWADKGSSELQNCDEASFQNSIPRDQTRSDSSFVWKCSKNLFTRRNQNRETVNRFWLCFSSTTGKVYCYACKLMSTQSTKLTTEGFYDWKYASVRLSKHETSKIHLELVMSLAQQRKAKRRIDQKLAIQEAQQVQY